MKFLGDLLKSIRHVQEKYLAKQRAEQILKDNESIKRQVLTDFINNIYNANNLPPSLVKQNLESSIIELVYSNGDHGSCGLLISTDGYFITCYHCVNKDLQDLSILLHDGSIYSQLKLCGYSAKYDIALLKAPIPVLAQAIKYPFYIDNKLNQAVKTSSNFIVTMTRRKGALIIIGGSSHGDILEQIGMKNGTFFEKQVHYESSSSPGDSGGAVVRSTDLKVCGIHASMDLSSSGRFYTQWHHAIEIISRYAHSGTGQ